MPGLGFLTIPVLNNFGFFDDLDSSSSFLSRINCSLTKSVTQTKRSILGVYHQRPGQKSGLFKYKLVGVKSNITELCFIPIILDAVVLDPGHQALAFLLLLLLAWRHRACVQATRRLDSGPGKSGTFLQI